MPIGKKWWQTTTCHSRPAFLPTVRQALDKLRPASTREARRGEAGGNLTRKGDQPLAGKLQI